MGRVPLVIAPFCLNLIKLAVNIIPNPTLSAIRTKVGGTFTQLIKLTLVNNKLSGVGRWGGESFSYVDQRVFNNPSGAGLQRVFTLEESRPRRIQPVLVLDVSLLASVDEGIFADLFIFVFDVLGR